MIQLWANHKYGYNSENKLMTDRDDFKIGKIIIGNDCWIGSNVTILNNVDIGDNVIIGANNLIYKSIPSNTIVKAKVDQLLTTNN
jgi:acetyltransferase-like isoleucine patch superfamily enzyme